ncbi:MAG: PAS domain S-box protein [Nitrospiraceae bacterium]
MEWSFQRLRAHRPYAWLPALIFLSIVAALVIGLLALRFLETRLIATTGESLSLAAAEVADKLDRLLFERYGDVEMIARAFSRRVSDQAYVKDYLAWMKQSYGVYLWLGVTDKEGRIIAATDPATIGQDLSRRVWFRSVRDGRTVHVGDVEPYEAAGGVDSVAFTAPIVGPDGGFLGAVSTRVALPVLEDVAVATIRALQKRRQGSIGTIEYQFLTREGLAFVDSDLWHKGNVNLKTLGVASARLLDSGQPGYVEEEHLRRHVHVVTGYARTQGHRAFPGLQWGVLVRVDRSDILAPIWEVLWKVGLAGAVIWVPMVGLLFWAMRRVQQEYVQAQQESMRARAAEATMRQSEARTRSIVQTALDAVIGMDAAGVITEWNPQAERTFGWSRQETIGQSLSATIVPLEYREAHERGLKHFLATGEGPILNKRFEITACHRDGHEFPVELSISPVRLGETYTFSAFVRDITERKRAERRLAAQYAVTRALAESSTLQEAGSNMLQAICESLDWELGGLWSVDRRDGLLRCVDVWHVPSVEAVEFIVDSKQRTFLPGIGLPGRVWSSGQPAWIPDVVKDANFPRAPIAAQVGLHGAFAFPIRVGNQVHGVLEFFSHQIREPDRELLEMVADIGIKVGQFVERKQAENALDQAEAQLRQSQKMEAVGRLAGGVAHDFNNLLTVITGYSQLVLGRLGPTDSLRSLIEEIQRAGDRAATLTSQLLAFSRRQVLAPKTLDLNKVVGDMGGMLRRLLGEDIELLTILQPGLGIVRADPSQFEQVIMNLAVNARDAMPKGGKLILETANATLGRNPGQEPIVAEPGPYVVLTVKDTGCGMDAEVQSHLFEPFFTTKEEGKGTGLGLSTVYGIVKQSGGSIEVHSEPGKGTSVQIYLPQIAVETKVAEPRRVPVKPPSGSETVLLVEDEGMIRTMVGTVLRLHGYLVLEARDGPDALRVAREHAGPIHLLLTDVVMPGMSGREVAERLVSVRRDLKVLYMSGYTIEAMAHHGLSDAATEFIQKPFTPNALAQKVSEALGKSRTA